MIRRSNSSSWQRFVSFPEPPDWMWRLPSSFLSVKRTQRGVNHSSPPSTEVKNKWSYISTPPIHLHDVDRISFTFRIYILFKAIYIYIYWVFRTKIPNSYLMTKVFTLPSVLPAWWLDPLPPESVPNGHQYKQSIACLQWPVRYVKNVAPAVHLDGSGQWQLSIRGVAFNEIVVVRGDVALP